MDEWSILDEVDVLAKWPSEQKKAVLDAESKWKERKDGLEILNTIIEQNPRLSTASMTIYGELMDVIRKILDRESNIVVTTTAIRTVELMALGLRHKFGGFIGMVVPFLIKRAKDKKKNVRDAVLATMIAVADTTTPERLLKDVVDWFGIPSPESKQTLLAFCFAYFCRQNAPDVPFVKAVAPLIVKAASESDATVRDKACQALGGLRRLMGEAISAFLVPIATETQKTEKINQYLEEAILEHRKYLESQPTSTTNGQSAAVTSEDTVETNRDTEAVVASTALDPWDIADAEDVTKKIEKGVEAQLIDKNWKERLEGAESIKKSMSGMVRIDLSDRLIEILKVLIKIIEKDVNVNVASLSAQILKDVAQKARFAYAPLAHRAFPVVFDKLKDKKAVLRDALVEYCDEAANTTPLSAYIEAIISALASKNPQTRQQVALFLAKLFGKNDAKTLEIEAVKQLSEHVQKATNDADKEVREAAIRIVAAIQKSMGEAIAKRLLSEVYEDKLKADKIPTIVTELEKDHGTSAATEMLRLAKHYKIGGPAPSAPSTKSSAAPPKRAVASRSVTVIQKTSGSSTVSSRPASSIARTTVTQNVVRPSTTVRPMAHRAPSPKAPSTSASKLFQARPAPNFGNKVTAAPKPIAKVSAAPRPSAPLRVAPIAPNVVRRQDPPNLKPIGTVRPSTASGIGAPRSRIAIPSSSTIAGRPGSRGGQPRPLSNSRVARPPS